VSSSPLPAGARTLGVDLRKGSDDRTFTLLVDGAAAGSLKTTAGFATLISWSGLDIGRDRGNPVGPYAAPFSFTGRLRKVTVTMDGAQDLDHEAVGNVELARQ
jgi:arylsulfatase